MLRKKIIGRQQTEHGEYMPGQAYGKKFIVTLFDCCWESKHDNNTSAPATLNTQTGTITENTTDWKKKWGSYKQWLIDNGYQKMDATNVKDGNNNQHQINASFANEIGSDSTPESIKGRIANLEEAVGSGGSVDERIAEEGARHYLKNETYTKEEVNGMITTPNQEYVSVEATEQTTAATDVLPATGAADTIYRVANWDGSQYDDSVYSEYAWNGTQYIHLSTKTQIGEVFDISAYHATGGTLATYTDLADALTGTNGGVPQSLQKGGMSIKFVLTSDNKYVQYFCMAQNFTTDTTQWQGVDDNLIAGSNNLVKSGGVYADIYTKILNPDAFSVVGFAGNYPSGVPTPNPIRYSLLLDVNEGDTVNVSLSDGYKCFISLYSSSIPSSSSLTRDLGWVRTATVESGETLLIITVGRSNNGSISESDARNATTITIDRSLEQRFVEATEELSIKKKYFKFTGEDSTLQRIEFKNFVANNVLHINFPSTSWNISNVPNGYPIFSVDYIDVEGTTKTIFIKVKGSYINSDYYITIPSNIGVEGCFFVNLRANLGEVVYVGVEDYTNMFKTLSPLYTQGHQGGIDDNGNFTTFTYRYRKTILNPLQNKCIECVTTPNFRNSIYFYNDLIQSSETFISNSGEHHQRSYAVVPPNCKSIVILFAEIHNYNITEDDIKDNYIINYSNEDFNVSDCYNSRFSIIGSGNIPSEKVIKGFLKNKRYRFTINNEWNTSTITSGYAKFILAYYDTTNILHEVVAALKSNGQTLAKYYEFDVPSDINKDGAVTVKIRADVGENVIINVEPIETVGHIINSRIFHSCKQAWTDKNNKYESWPNGGVMADGDQIVIFYNSSSAHVATDLVSDVVMRKKTTLGDWDEKKTILKHTANEGYGNPSCCMLPNGDYLVIAVVLTAENVSTELMALKMMKSSDKGETWTDMGNVQVGGTDVLDACMMDLFCTSTGKLISHVGGSVNSNSKYIASDDGGETWRFVGNALGGCLEACFYERDNGEILSILRKNNSDPALIKLNAELTEYEVLYTFGTFKFPAFFNPSSIIKLQSGELYLLGGSRRQDSDGKYLLFESIVTEDELLANNFSSRVILKAKASNLMDWGYAQAVIADDGTIYGYFYDSEGITGTTQIYEMLGC